MWRRCQVSTHIHKCVCGEIHADAGDRSDLCGGVGDGGGVHDVGVGDADGEAAEVLKVRPACSC